MAKPKTTPASVAAEIRGVLERKGSPDHAKGVQCFFKEEIKSHGWYTANLRRLAVHYRYLILKDHEPRFLVQVADRLFTGRVLEEKLIALFLLEKLTSRFADAEFALFESWLRRVTSWADHDGLAHYLIGPMIAWKPARVRKLFKWARSADRWHRRAACVCLIQGTRQRLLWPQVKRISNMLLRDQDDMVQKGLGWLLRESAKADPRRTVPYLLSIGKRSPRLVLRTACETLPPGDKSRILSQRLQ